MQHSVFGPVIVRIRNIETYNHHKGNYIVFSAEDLASGVIDEDDFIIFV